MSFNDLPDAYKVLTILRFYKQPATLKNEIGGDWNGKTNIYITDIFGHAAGTVSYTHLNNLVVIDVTAAPVILPAGQRAVTYLSLIHIFLIQEQICCCMEWASIR